MTKALKEAIAGLYDAFGREPKPLIVEGCGCCVSTQQMALLLSTPLRSITPSEMKPYAQHVFLEVGAVADFKYFLPRILEILAFERGWWPPPEVVGRSIARAWSTMTAAQQNAVHVFFSAVVADLVESRDGRALDEWICGIAHGGANLQPYLDLVEKDIAALVAFHKCNSDSLGKGRLGNSFWDSKSHDARMLLDWFQSDRVRDLIKTAYGAQ